MATRHILEQVIGLDNVIVAAITKMELMIGAINKIDRLKISKKLTRFDSELMTPQISLKAIELIDIYSLSHGLSISDSLIAATALVVKLPLFTYNVRDYKFISELELFNPNA